MSNDVKILAMYLPQFHEVPENSKFWGKGFTDWVSVKKASPLFKGIPNFRDTRIAMLRAETKEELFRIFDDIESSLFSAL